MWGANYWGQLGDGSVLRRDGPVLVTGLSGVTSVAAGRYHNLVLKSDGSVWAWGYNANGQLGDGTTINRSTPVQVPGLTGVVALAGGGYHSLALRSDGTVWAWGLNDSGQLGDGSTTSKSSPAPVPGVTGVAALAAGDAYTLARKSDGTVWAWGANEFGQLGDGSSVRRTSPLQVPGLNGTGTIAAGWFHALALKTDGTLWAWGNNEFGQLGDGSRAHRSSPVPVPGLPGVTVVAAGAFYSVALEADGTVRGWGRAAANGLSADQSNPAAPPFLRIAAKIAAGGWHAFTLDSQGRVVAWGNNSGGQLGIPGPHDSYVPRKVIDPLDPGITRNARAMTEFLNNRIGEGHYFVTPSYPEAQAIDAGAAGAGWARTGRSWRAWSVAAEIPAGVPAMPVYRFYAAGPNSHFFTLSESEKNGLVAINPTNDPQKGWALEGVGFYAVAPIPASAATPLANRDPFGNTCPPGYYPVFRAYNNRFAYNDSNHRITSSFIDIVRGLRFFGWADEGIAFCSPVATGNGGDLHAYHTFPGDHAVAGSPLLSEHFFTNAGPGDAPNATLHTALPRGLAWDVSCTASYGAVCPTGAQLAAVDDLARGVSLANLPAGGVLKLTAKATAPGTPQTLEFASAIDVPSGAPDPWTPNNQTNVSKTVVITPAQCTATLSTPKLNTAAAGTATGASQITLTAPAACSWSIVSDQPWIGLSPASGSGTAAIMVSVDANTLSAVRQATLTATAAANPSARSEALVVQSAAPAPTFPACQQVRLGREAEQVGPNIIQGMVGLFADTCAWEVGTTQHWITLTSSASGVGGGSIQYQVQANPDSAERHGSIVVVGKRLDIVQAGTATVAPPSYDNGGGDGGGDGGGSGGSGGGGSGGGAG